MKQEEAQLKLRMYHAKLFGKYFKRTSNTFSEFDAFEIFRIMAKRKKLAMQLKLF